MKKIIGITLISLIAGCASSIPDNGEIRQVPENRIYNFQTEKASIIHVIRDKTYSSAACYYRLYIDGVKAADFDEKEQASFFVDAGSHILSVKPEGNKFSCGSDYISEYETTLKGNDTKKIRLTFNPDRTIGIMPTAF